MAAVAWLLVGVFAVLVALTSVTLEWAQLLQGRRGFSVPDATRCAPLDGTGCTASLFNGATGLCDQRPYPKTRACTDACHVAGSASTACNAVGGCVGSDPRECLGYCVNASEAATCEAVLPINANFWNYTNGANIYCDPGNYLYNATYRCEYQVCQLTVVGVAAYWNGTATFAPARDCLDYLNATAAPAIAAGCVTAERFVLDPVLVPSYSAILTALGSVEKAQLFVCAYRYGCSTKNYTMITEAVRLDTPVY